ncbi:cysteine desulfurase family protein [Acidomonas methanolica]|uniref:cysteine desulfurase family protein n=1 Tax=Acidomonas methanolica TaxID=437 RepID=UPI002119C888|nr:aminotransferase class V-fold PLP-dependent enzyme [Acidomonas methanolica]MCQ9154443.1 aminotransferase class V-fold PLP-dependent enzyme [Acidomonas methanolica]
MTVYLDANASEPLRPAAFEAMARAAFLSGNPSSIHAEGQAARRVLEDARHVLAEAFGTEADGVIFTSGGTEANALALHAFRRQRMAMGATEHDAIRTPARRHAQVTALSVTPEGTLDIDALGAFLDSGDAALVCVMAANNETGVLHPIREIAARCRSAGAWLHVDAVQAAGRVPVTLDTLGADSLAISGHKFGGPKGAGALLTRAATVDPLIQGGGQERGRRGGTPPLPAIAGMAAALREALAEDGGQQRVWRDRIEAAAREVGARVAGADAPRLGQTSALVLDGVAAQTQLIALDLAGYAVSAGAACSSGKVAFSHVLDAMGYGVAAGHAIRVSLPWNVEESDVEGFIAAYRAMALRLGGAGRRA